MTDPDALRQARGLLAELSGSLEAWSDYAEPWLAERLRARSQRIDQFLTTPTNREAGCANNAPAAFK